MGGRSGETFSASRFTKVCYRLDNRRYLREDREGSVRNMVFHVPTLTSKFPVASVFSTLSGQDRLDNKTMHINSRVRIVR